MGSNASATQRACHPASSAMAPASSPATVAQAVQAGKPTDTKNCSVAGMPRTPALNQAWLRYICASAKRSSMAPISAGDCGLLKSALLS
jgi:hypothetical protein